MSVVCILFTNSNNAGITKQTTDPEGGQIDRYPVGHPLSGEPTGIIREFTEKLFEDFLTPTKSDLLSAIRGQFVVPVSVYLSACLSFCLSVRNWTPFPLLMYELDSPYAYVLFD